MCPRPSVACASSRSKGWITCRLIATVRKADHRELISDGGSLDSNPAKMGIAQIFIFISHPKNTSVKITGKIYILVSVLPHHFLFHYHRHTFFHHPYAKLPMP
jgi:hypothetical protein